MLLEIGGNGRNRKSAQEPLATVLMSAAKLYSRVARHLPSCPEMSLEHSESGGAVGNAATDTTTRASEDNASGQLVSTLREQIDDLLQQVSQLNGKVSNPFVIIMYLL